jgi:hypothetical protein
VSGLLNVINPLQVHPAKEENFKFVSGVKKHYQFSVVS